MPPTERFGPRDLLVALMVNVVWGLNIVAVKLSVDLAPPFTVALFRQAMVLLVCLPWLRIIPGRMGDLIGLSILIGGVFFAFVNTSIEVTENVGALAIAGLMGAPFSLILAIIFLKERIGWPRIAGMTLALAGCSLLVFDPSAAREWFGITLNMIASLIWAFGSLLQRRLTGVHVLTIYAWIGLGGVIILGPLALVMETDTMTGVAAIPPMAFVWIGFSAFGSTILGNGGMAWLLQRHPVSTVIPVTLGAPVVGVVASSIVFGNALTPVMVLGGAIAMAGVAIVTMRTAKAGEKKA